MPHPRKAPVESPATIEPRPSSRLSKARATAFANSRPSAHLGPDEHEDCDTGHRRHESGPPGGLINHGRRPGKTPSGAVPAQVNACPGNSRTPSEPHHRCQRARPPIALQRRIRGIRPRVEVALLPEALEKPRASLAARALSRRAAIRSMTVPAGSAAASSSASSTPSALPWITAFTASRVRVAVRAGHEQSLGDVGQHGLHLLRRCCPNRVRPPRRRYSYSGSPERLCSQYRHSARSNRTSGRLLGAVRWKKSWVPGSRTRGERALP